MDTIYSAWSQTCSEIVHNRLDNWKTLNDVYYMLEHVHGDYAKVYIEKIIDTGLSIADIQTYTLMVDAIGKATTYTITHGSEQFISSTTCLRYLYHALDIFSKIKQLGVTPNIIEIGGGYGGLAVAFNYVLNYYNYDNPINYTIIDLKHVQELQNYYLSNFNLNKINVDFIEADTYGMAYNKDNAFIVSNYCLGEMGEENRNNYITHLFSKPTIIGGYLQWNSGASTDFLNRFKCDIQDESPKTGPDNKTIVFGL